MVINVHEEMVKCICGTCPTFKSFKDNHGFFCAQGARHKDVQAKACKCGECPVYKTYGLTKGFWCGATEVKLVKSVATDVKSSFVPTEPSLG